MLLIGRGQALKLSSDNVAIFEASSTSSDADDAIEDASDSVSEMFEIFES